MQGVPFGESLADAIADELGVSYENVDVIDHGFINEDGYPVGSIVVYGSGRRLPSRVGVAVFKETADFASHYYLL